MTLIEDFEATRGVGHDQERSLAMTALLIYLCPDIEFLRIEHVDGRYTNISHVSSVFDQASSLQKTQDASPFALQNLRNLEMLMHFGDWPANGLSNFFNLISSETVSLPSVDGEIDFKGCIFLATDVTFDCGGLDP